MKLSTKNSTDMMGGSGTKKYNNIVTNDLLRYMYGNAN